MLELRALDVCQREAVVYCDYYQAFQGPTANDASEAEFCSAVKSKLVQLFTRDAFQVIEAGPLDGSLLPENEYQFEVKFEAITNYTDNGPNPRMTLVLKFDRGSFWDPVKWWEVEEKGDTSDMNNWQPLLAKLEQSVRNGPDILNIVEEYEKRPESVEIGMDKEVLDPGEKIKIHVYSFKDARGNDSEPFNRLVVHVEEGELLNGAETDIGPDYYAFLAERGMVSLEYRAPDDCENLKEKIIIYNSCDVLPEQNYFLHRTMLKDQLEEKEFDINCFDAQITIAKNHNRVLQTSSEGRSRQINETISASGNVYLELNNTVDMPILNQTWHYYQPVQVSVNSFRNIYKEKTHISTPESETNIDIARINKSHKIEGEEYISQFPPWMLVVDNETQKAVKLIPAGYGIEFEFAETEKSVSISSQKKDTHTETRHGKSSFELGPVGEKGPDPTVKSSSTWIEDYVKRQGIELPPGASIPNIPNSDVIQEIQPDVLVKSGDGISNFGGWGDRLIDIKLEDGFDRTNLNYRWTMTIKQKD